MFYYGNSNYYQIDNIRSNQQFGSLPNPNSIITPALNVPSMPKTYKKYLNDDHLMEQKLAPNFIYYDQQIAYNNEQQKLNNTRGSISSQAEALTSRHICSHNKGLKMNDINVSIQPTLQQSFIHPITNLNYLTPYMNEQYQKQQQPLMCCHHNQHQYNLQNHLPNVSQMSYLANQFHVSNRYVEPIAKDCKSMVYYNRAVSCNPRRPVVEMPTKKNLVKNKSRNSIYDSYTTGRNLNNLNNFSKYATIRNVDMNSNAKVDCSRYLIKNNKIASINKNGQKSNELEAIAFIRGKTKSDAEQPLKSIALDESSLSNINKKEKSSSKSTIETKASFIKENNKTDKKDKNENNEKNNQIKSLKNKIPAAPPINENLFKSNENLKIANNSSLVKKQTTRDTDEDTTQGFDAVVDELKKKLDKIRLNEENNVKPVSNESSNNSNNDVTINNQTKSKSAISSSTNESNKAKLKLVSKIKNDKKKNNLITSSLSSSDQTTSNQNLDLTQLSYSSINSSNNEMSNKIVQKQIKDVPTNNKIISSVANSFKLEVSEDNDDDSDDYSKYNRVKFSPVLISKQKSTGDLDKLNPASNLINNDKISCSPSTATKSASFNYNDKYFDSIKKLLQIEKTNSFSQKNEEINIFPMASRLAKCKSDYIGEFCKDERDQFINNFINEFKAKKLAAFSTRNLFNRNFERSLSSIDYKTTFNIKTNCEEEISKIMNKNDELRSNDNENSKLITSTNIINKEFKPSFVRLIQRKQQENSQQINTKNIDQIKFTKSKSSAQFYEQNQLRCAQPISNTISNVFSSKYNINDYQINDEFLNTLKFKAKSYNQIPSKYSSFTDYTKINNKNESESLSFKDKNSKNQQFMSKSGASMLDNPQQKNMSEELIFRARSNPKKISNLTIFKPTNNIYNEQLIKNFGSNCDYEMMASSNLNGQLNKDINNEKFDFINYENLNDFNVMENYNYNLNNIDSKFIEQDIGDGSKMYTNEILEEMKDISISDSDHKNLNDYINEITNYYNNLNSNTELNSLNFDDNLVLNNQTINYEN